MEDIILLGGGGHCKSVIDTINSLGKYNIVGILDIKDKKGSKIYNIEVIGTDDELINHYNNGVKNAFISLGSIGDTRVRRKLNDNIKNVGMTLPNIIDPTAILPENIEIGEGNFIGKGVILNSDVKIGVNCIINSGSIIEHDCIVDDYVHIAPGSTLSGSVNIGSDSHIGTNSAIIQNIVIGENTIIGAGSVVVKDIGNNKKAYGNPCREV
jgi:sugar O-acyltransferase (sialic acid O-acetyltransferase NeuD family)